MPDKTPNSETPPNPEACRRPSETIVGRTVWEFVGFRA